MVDNITLKNHQKVITHAVAQWLEDIHELSVDLNSVKPHSSKDAVNEQEIFKVLFDHLRGGKL